MKRILLLGGSHRDIPLIQASQALGYYVITLGDRNYYLGHNYSNKAYRVNFNDLEKVKEIIQLENIEYLLPGSGEESYLNTVKLSHQLNIGNFDKLEIAQLVHNKWTFKEFCLNNNISTPKGLFYNKNIDLESLIFPLVVKPTNLSGGRGVEIVYNEKQLQLALNTASYISDEIFLEEFIDGELIAYSIFLKNQKIEYEFTGIDKVYLNKYLITTAYPIKLDQVILKKLKENIEKIAKLLNLVNGMFHLQILIKNQKPYIIDVTRRIPGDLYPYLIEHNDNVKYSQAVVKAYTTGNIHNEFNQKKLNDTFVIRHCIMPNKNGKFKKIYFDKNLKKNIIYTLELIKPNTIVTDFFNTQLAIVFIQLKESNNKLLDNINELIYPIMDEG